MAAPLSIRKAPWCVSCVRRLADDALRGWTPFFQQTRNASAMKKKKEAMNNIPVRLLEDLKEYGRKGSIVPVAPGKMRNIWYPRRYAQYIPQAEIKQLRLKNTLIERDYEYGKEKPQTAQIGQAAAQPEQPAGAREPRVKAAAIELLTPQRTLELIKIFVPARIDFHRTPIEGEAQNSPASAPNNAVSGAASILAAAERPTSRPATTSIYGSVSTADVLASIRNDLARNDEAARIVLTEEDVKFTNLREGDETNRVKRLGDFEVDIKIKGAEEPLRKVVRVLPEIKMSSLAEGL